MNTNRPLISIIIPVYNSEMTIGECLQSLINQSYENIELIVIDDGSDDNSLNKCKTIAKMDQRIRLLSQANHGVAYTRNVGISSAHGQYVMFVDSDDLVSKTFCEDAINNSLKYNSDMVLLSYKKVKQGNIADVQMFGTEDMILSKNIVMKNILHYSYGCFYLYRKELFEGISYPMGKTYEDLSTIYKMVDKANVISYSAKCNYSYVESANSIIANMSQKNIADQFEAAWNVMEFLRTSYPMEYKENLTELAVFAIRYCTYCSKNFNIVLYNRALNVIKHEPITSKLDVSHRVILGLFKFSVPLAKALLLIRRKTNQ